MIDTLKIYENLKEDITPSAAKKITEAIGQVYTELLNTVTKEEFRDLKEAVTELAEAQKKSEQRLTRIEHNVEELVEAQKITEQRLEEFEKRTEENFNRVWKAIENLTRAQQKTEQRLEEFEKRTEENFNRVWKAIENLTRAQEQTEKELKSLIQDHKRTREIVNGLSETVGYGLEDKLFPYMRDFVKKEYGVEVEVLDRRNVIYSNGKFDEVNIYVEGRKGRQKVYIVGECKSKPGKKDIKKFNEVLKRLKQHIGKDVMGFIVGYQYSPEVEKYLENKYPHIKKMKSFEFELNYQRK